MAVWVKVRALKLKLDLVISNITNVAAAAARLHHCCCGYCCRIVLNHMKSSRGGGAGWCCGFTLILQKLLYISLGNPPLNRTPALALRMPQTDLRCGYFTIMYNYLEVNIFI